ncbi:hypothetical protein FHS43_002694 [Streptosporangium becharense]|uniref:DUF2087 domain-containing protein n=1 Tax=Streptosporangium becharense TaxID=1816182 RepID=A0A7W9MJK0_9ACTN|nr:DUF2087 domain-containing protein [Streptosporangium becharense]MBB2911421.1 hypothetical protein [Streptosporangium becharense]MBB5822761.1 hypothetical protein [Streptosporangium becharense]
MNDEAIRQVLGLLYQEDTLRVLSALALGGTPEGAGLDREATRRALDRLERGGLVSRQDDGAWRVRRERFRELLHATARPAPPASTEEKVLQSFLVDGRLRAIPSKRDKQLVVLDYVAQVFEPGVRYSEREVNVALRAFHDDYAALRRYLVDEALLSRENNVYWRSGGSVDA